MQSLTGHQKSEALCSKKKETSVKAKKTKNQTNIELWAMKLHISKASLMGSERNFFTLRQVLKQTLVAGCTRRVRPFGREGRWSTEDNSKVPPHRGKSSPHPGESGLWWVVQRIHEGCSLLAGGCYRRPWTDIRSHLLGYQRSVHTIR